MPTLLRVGMAGLGFASTLTLPDLARHPGFRVVAAADTRQEALDRFQSEFGGQTFSSVEAMCASGDVDVVYVSTPNFLHAENTITAAEYRKHILCEKPMAVTMDECDAMVEAVERNGVKLVYGHTHSYDPPIRKMREFARNGRIGPLTMLNLWNFTDLLYRPRAQWELDTSKGGGIVYIQAPHQIDIVRYLGGGMLRSVRAMTGVWDPARPTEGSLVAYVEFENGVPATMVYSGYGHFDTAELHYWVGETGLPRDPETHARTQAYYRQRTAGQAEYRDTAVREAMRYGGAPAEGSLPRPAFTGERHQAFFGVVLASFQWADVRQSADGLYLYGEQGKQEIPVSLEESGRKLVLDDLYAAVTEDRPPQHDVRWGRATIEVCLAILESARTRREVFLSRQVPTRD